MRAAERLRYAVLAAQREGNRQLAAGLAPRGIGPAQAEAIRVLADHGPMSLSSLGALLICEGGGSPSRLVDRLAKAGYVDRLASRDDRRQVVIALTSAGLDLNDYILEVEAAMYHAIEHALTDDHADQISNALQSLIGGSAAAEALDRRIATSRD
jgi:DNA-binding MarR family transcriptional regulator